VIGARVKRRANDRRILAVENAPAAEFELVAEAQRRRGMTEQLVLLAVAQAAAMGAGAAGIGDPFIALHADRELGLDHLDRRVRRHVEEADRARRTVVIGFAALRA